MTDVDGVFRGARHLRPRLDARRDDIVAVEAARAGLGDRAENAVIGAAAAEMTGKRRADFLARRRGRSLRCAPAIVKRRRLDDEARRAEAALQGVVRHERLLDRMQSRRRRCLRPSSPTCRPPARAGIRQLTTGAPSTSTVQAPQTPAPHTSLVPVRSRVSRTTSMRSASGSSGRGAARPLIVIVLICDLQVCGGRISSQVAALARTRLRRGPTAPATSVRSMISRSLRKASTGCIAG